MRRGMSTGLVALIASLGCSSLSGDDPFGGEGAPSRVADALTLSKIAQLTEVHVAGEGALDVESKYLPQVVCCEHGAARGEALKAQAVMARTYVYFRYHAEGLGTSTKPLRGTTADQAYFCSRPATQACHDAVAATRDQITAYTSVAGQVIANASFYVDGPRPACLATKACRCAKPGPKTPMTPSDHPSACDCFTFGSAGAANPAFVTYNWATSGADVEGSAIGHKANESNRGCASQNVQNCLAIAGWSYPDLLRMFYGQDVALRYPDGSLVADAVLPPTPAEPPRAGIVATQPAPPASPASPESEAVEESASPVRSEGAASGGCRAAADAGATPGGALLAALSAMLLLQRRRGAPGREDGISISARILRS